MRTSGGRNPVKIRSIFTRMLAMLQAIEKDFLLNR
jgi:hypothetical protein